MANILLFIDDEAFHSTLAQTLTANGHVVALAADGFEGTKSFRASPADLVLCA